MARLANIRIRPKEFLLHPHFHLLLCIVLMLLLLLLFPYKCWTFINVNLAVPSKNEKQHNTKKLRSPILRNTSPKKKYSSRCLHLSYPGHYTHTRTNTTTLMLTHAYTSSVTDWRREWQIDQIAGIIYAYLSLEYFAPDSAVSRKNPYEKGTFAYSKGHWCVPPCSACLVIWTTYFWFQAEKI